jgi:predicted SPOUT superfamily RNA methylase MTH1
VEETEVLDKTTDLSQVTYKLYHIFYRIVTVYMIVILLI